ncbi:MAG: LrgB family protein [Gammaproteobacteria bacterium]|nr:LrgB family protein [Gammaproteobacteria bacterium]
MNRLNETFVYLGQQPLLWLFLTVAIFQLASQLQRKLNTPLANPVAIAAAAIGVILWASDTPYSQYFEGAQFVHFLLGPAVVSLAFPLARELPKVRRVWLPISVSLVVGLLVAPLSVWLLCQALTLTDPVQMSLLSKHVTSPVAMGIANQMGGIASLAAGLSVLTGIFGAIVVSPLFNRLGFVDYRARGFATGLNCHGIGTAHAFSVHPVAGSYAVIGMALSAALSSLLIPLLFLAR